MATLVTSAARVSMGVAAAIALSAATLVQTAFAEPFGLASVHEPEAGASAATFAENVGAAKSSMMSHPAAALAAAERAFSGRTTDAEGATALWLQAEALTRLGRPQDALGRLATARAYVVGEQTKLSGDLSLAEARTRESLEQEARSLAAYQEAHATFHAVGDDRGKAMALLGIANLYKRARRWDRALAYFDQAGAAFPSDDALTFALNNNKASVFREIGDLPRARATFTENLVIAERLGTPFHIANANLQMADTAIEAKDLDAARAHMEAAATLRTGEGAATWRRFDLFVQARLATAERDDAATAELLRLIFADWDGAEISAANQRSHALAAAFYEGEGALARALAHTKALAVIDADLNGAAAANSFNLLNAEFEASNRELLIERLNSARLEAEVAASAERERTRSIIVGIVGLAAAGVLSVVLWHLRSAWRASRELEDANADLVQANEAKTRFLANTSHEIRTPLNAILGMAEALLTDEDERPMPTPSRRRIETIERSGKLLLSIVTDILDVSKMEGGKLEPKRAATDLCSLIADVKEMHEANAEAKGLTIEIDVPSALPGFVTDGRLVTQAIGNLVSNAIKFTDEGSVRVAARQTPSGFEAVVSDTGLGIPPENLRTIFDAFSQVDGGADRRFGGTGLGLTIVRDIAELLGGTVEVSSEVGVGSSFTFSIDAPRTTENPRAADAGTGSAAAGPDLSTLDVLLAEDNPVNVAVVRALIGGLVASLDVATDGVSAVERVKLKPYDLVLMDNQMPGMSGTDATAIIRTLPGRETMPIVGVTADIAPAVTEQLLASGMDLIVAKPVSRDGLIQAMKTAVSARRGGAASGAAASA